MFEKIQMNTSGNCKVLLIVWREAYEPNNKY